MPVCLAFPIHKKEEAAFDLHGFEDDANRDARQAIHIQNIADALAVLVDGAAGVVMVAFCPVIDRARDQPQKRRKDDGQQQRNDGARQQRGNGFEEGLQLLALC